MVKNKTQSHFALIKKNCLNLLLELSGMIQNTNERHFEAVKHILNTVAVKNTLAAMKKNVDIVKLDPVMRIAPGKKLELQRKSFSTAKRKWKHIVKYAKPAEEEKVLFMSQTMFGEETVEKNVTVRDTEEGAIKLTKGMTKLCFK